MTHPAQATLPPLSTPAVPGPSARLSTGVTLHYQSAGDGPALIFIPGWTCSHEFFNKQVDAFKGNYRVIRYDPRGQGKSEKTTEGHNFKQRGADLAAFIEFLGLSKVTLVGWSYGSYDMWSYIQQFGTARLAGAVVIDQPPKSPYDPAVANTWGEVSITSSSEDSSAVGGFFRFVVDARKDFWTYYAKYMLNKPTDTTPDTDPEVQQIVEWGLQTPQSVATQILADGAFSDYTETAKSLNNSAVPTLYFAREDWGNKPIDWLAANANNAQIARIASHMGFWTESENFNSRLLAFLNSVAKR